MKLLFDRIDQNLKLFDDDGSLTRVWACHNQTVGSTDPQDVYGHLGPIPPGVGYTAGPAQPIDPPIASEGAFQLPIGDNPAGALAAHGRSELMIHGGGSAAPYPLAPRQGWYPTEGCLRMQNEDLAALVVALQGAIVRLDIPF